MIKYNSITVPFSISIAPHVKATLCISKVVVQEAGMNKPTYSNDFNYAVIMINESGTHVLLSGKSHGGVSEGELTPESVEVCRKILQKDIDSEFARNPDWNLTT